MELETLVMGGFHSGEPIEADEALKLRR